MNAHDLRVWLQTAVGKVITFQGVQGENMQGERPTASAAPNGTCELYFPITINRLARPSGFGYELAIRNSTMASRHGVYLPDAVNQCTRVNATANGIVISGQFSGCTFAKCTVAPDVFVGHIYVSFSTPGNDPTAQARSFELACRAAANSAVGWRTAGAGRIVPPASYGYVIGTLDNGTWQWNWITIQRSDNTVVTCTAIAPTDWVAL